MLILALATAVFLRFYQLGHWPPGLYRDEAFNGLDALGVLRGDHTLFFPANNGREPTYIYLTAFAVALFGRSAPAVRLAAAVVGSATTIPVYLLGRDWFGQHVGLLAAWLWATTLWPVHLSRIGLRPILLAPCLALTFWLGTHAYRRQDRRRWLAAGAVYGLSYYTYLAVRFTPVLFTVLGIYLLWQQRQRWRQWATGALWFGVGTAVTLLPFTILTLQNPDIMFGRIGQVSIFQQLDGPFWQALGVQLWRGAGMFFWRGDTILRHNPGGRPVFDALMVIPFLLGVIWCLRQWQRPPVAATLLWTAVMLGPTVLAADAPHFLRAAGVLPGLLLLPALGLAWLWQWAPSRLGGGVVTVLLVGSLLFTVRDYATYAQDVETGYLFEQAARELAQEISGDGAHGAGKTAVFVDERFWSGWPSIRFLVERDVTLFHPDNGLPVRLPLPFAVYAWPFNYPAIPLDSFGPVLVAVEEGAETRGDLEPTPYPLYVRYSAAPAPDKWPLAVNFGNKLALRRAAVRVVDSTVQVELVWEGKTAVSPTLTTFVHIAGPDGLIAQDDAPPGDGYIAPDWWQPDTYLYDQHVISLPTNVAPAQHQILVGLYDAATGERLPLLNENGRVTGDAYPLSVNGNR